jgi:hypothetical protein
MSNPAGRKNKKTGEPTKLYLYRTSEDVATEEQAEMSKVMRQIRMQVANTDLDLRIRELELELELGCPVK